MWKIVYNSSTLRVTAVNSRDPQAGESVSLMDPTKCSWANVYPDRYTFNAAGLVERPEWADEEAERVFAQLKTDRQAANKANCRAHILARYSEDTQRNAALMIYGEEFVATCADFIARCIAVEDAAFDAVTACTTAEEIAALPAVVFPEV